MEQTRPAILTLNRLNMFTDNPDYPTNRSKLSWSIRNLYPRLSVFYNNPRDLDLKSTVYVSFDPISFQVLLDQMKALALSKKEEKFKVSSYMPRRIEGQKRLGKEYIADLYVGRNAEGMCWISIVQKDMPKPVFVFDLEEFVVFHNLEGNPIPAPERSSLALLATVRYLTHAMVAYKLEESFMLSQAPTTEFSTDAPSFSPDSDLKLIE